MVCIAIALLVFNNIGIQFARIVAGVGDKCHVKGVDVAFIAARESPVNSHVVGVF